MQGNLIYIYYKIQFSQSLFNYYKKKITKSNLLINLKIILLTLMNKELNKFY